MRKWVKAIICGCLAYEFGMWFSGHLILSSPEWVPLAMKLVAEVMGVMCGILMVLLYDKEEGG